MTRNCHASLTNSEELLLKSKDAEAPAQIKAFILPSGRKSKTSKHQIDRWMKVLLLSPLIRAEEEKTVKRKQNQDGETSQSEKYSEIKAVLRGEIKEPAAKTAVPRGRSLHTGTLAVCVRIRSADHMRTVSPLTRPTRQTRVRARPYRTCTLLRARSSARWPQKLLW